MNCLFFLYFHVSELSELSVVLKLTFVWMILYNVACGLCKSKCVFRIITPSMWRVRVKQTRQRRTCLWNRWLITFPSEPGMERDCSRRYAHIYAQTHTHTQIYVYLYISLFLHLSLRSRASAPAEYSPRVRTFLFHLRRDPRSTNRLIQAVARCCIN